MEMDSQELRDLAKIIGLEFVNAGETSGIKSGETSGIKAGEISGINDKENLPTNDDDVAPNIQLPVVRTLIEDQPNTSERPSDNRTLSQEITDFDRQIDEMETKERKEIEELKQKIYLIQVKYKIKKKTLTAQRTKLKQKKKRIIKKNSANVTKLPLKPIPQELICVVPNDGTSDVGCQALSAKASTSLSVDKPPGFLMKDVPDQSPSRFHPPFPVKSIFDPLSDSALLTEIKEESDTTSNCIPDLIDRSSVSSVALTNAVLDTVERTVLTTIHSSEQVIQSQAELTSNITISCEPTSVRADHSSNIYQQDQPLFDNNLTEAIIDTVSLEQSDLETSKNNKLSFGDSKKERNSVHVDHYCSHGTELKSIIKVEPIFIDEDNDTLHIKNEPNSIIDDQSVNPKLALETSLKVQPIIVEQNLFPIKTEPKASSSDYDSSQQTSFSASKVIAINSNDIAKTLSYTASERTSPGLYENETTSAEGINVADQTGSQEIAKHNHLQHGIRFPQKRKHESTKYGTTDEGDDKLELLSPKMEPVLKNFKKATHDLLEPVKGQMMNSVVPVESSAIFNVTNKKIPPDISESSVKSLDPSSLLEYRSPLTVTTLGNQPTNFDSIDMEDNFLSKPVANIARGSSSSTNNRVKEYQKTPIVANGRSYRYEFTSFSPFRVSAIPVDDPVRVIRPIGTELSPGKQTDQSFRKAPVIR